MSEIKGDNFFKLFSQTNASKVFSKEKLDNFFKDLDGDGEITGSEIAQGMEDAMNEIGSLSSADSDILAALQDEQDAISEQEWDKYLDEAYSDGSVGGNSSAKTNTSAANPYSEQDSQAPQNNEEIAASVAAADLTGTSSELREKRNADMAKLAELRSQRDNNEAVNNAKAEVDAAKIAYDEALANVAQNSEDPRIVEIQTSKSNNDAEIANQNTLKSGLTSDISTTQGNINGLKNELSGLVKPEKQSEDDPTYEDRLQAYETKKAQLEQQIRQEEDALSNLNQQLTDCETRIQELEASNIELDAQLQEVLANMEVEEGSLEEALQIALDAYNEAQANLQAVELEQNAQINVDIAQLEANLTAYDGAIVEQETIEQEALTQQNQPQEPTEYGSAHATAINDNTQEPAENGPVNQPTEFGSAPDEYGTQENEDAADTQAPADTTTQTGALTAESTPDDVVSAVFADSGVTTISNIEDISIDLGAPALYDLYTTLGAIDTSTLSPEGKKAVEDAQAYVAKAVLSGIDQETGQLSDEFVKTWGDNLPQDTVDFVYGCAQVAANYVAPTDGSTPIITQEEIDFAKELDSAETAPADTPQQSLTRTDITGTTAAQEFSDSTLAPGEASTDALLEVFGCSSVDQMITKVNSMTQDEAEAFFKEAGIDLTDVIGQAEFSDRWATQGTVAFLSLIFQGDPEAMAIIESFNGGASSAAITGSEYVVSDATQMANFQDEQGRYAVGTVLITQNADGSNTHTHTVIGYDADGNMLVVSCNSSAAPNGASGKDCGNGTTVNIFNPDGKCLTNPNENGVHIVGIVPVGQMAEVQSQFKEAGIEATPEQIVDAISGSSNGACEIKLENGSTVSFTVNNGKVEGPIKQVSADGTLELGTGLTINDLPDNLKTAYTGGNYENAKFTIDKDGNIFAEMIEELNDGVKKKTVTELDEEGNQKDGTTPKVSYTIPKGAAIPQDALSEFGTSGYDIDSLINEQSQVSSLYASYEIVNGEVRVMDKYGNQIATIDSTGTLKVHNSRLGQTSSANGDMVEDENGTTYSSVEAMSDSPFKTIIESEIGTQLPEGVSVRVPKTTDGSQPKQAEIIGADGTVIGKIDVEEFASSDDADSQNSYSVSITNKQGLEVLNKGQFAGITNVVDEFTSVGYSVPEDANTSVALTIASGDFAGEYTVTALPNEANGETQLIVTQTVESEVDGTTQETTVVVAVDNIDLTSQENLPEGFAVTADGGLEYDSDLTNDENLVTELIPDATSGSVSIALNGDVTQKVEVDGVIQVNSWEKQTDGSYANEPAVTYELPEKLNATLPEGCTLEKEDDNGYIIKDENGDEVGSYTFEDGTSTVTYTAGDLAGWTASLNDGGNLEYSINNSGKIAVNSDGTIKSIEDINGVSLSTLRQLNVPLPDTLNVLDDNFTFTSTENGYILSDGSGKSIQCTTSGSITSIEGYTLGDLEQLNQFGLNIPSAIKGAPQSDYELSVEFDGTNWYISNGSTRLLFNEENRPIAQTQDSNGEWTDAIFGIDPTIGNERVEQNGEDNCYFVSAVNSIYRSGMGDEITDAISFGSQGVQVTFAAPDNKTVTYSLTYTQIFEAMGNATVDDEKARQYTTGNFDVLVLELGYRQWHGEFADDFQVDLDNDASDGAELSALPTALGIETSTDAPKPEDGSAYGLVGMPATDSSETTFEFGDGTLNYAHAYSFYVIDNEVRLYDTNEPNTWVATIPLEEIGNYPELEWCILQPSEQIEQ